MPPAFDPYYTWLGIPPDEQPTNHYRLLGLRPFEQNLDVIENAADQRMAHLRTFQSGKRVKFAQKLLNEVAAARICLLNPQKKAAYDRQLKQLSRAEAAGSRKPPILASPPPRKAVARRPAGAAAELPGRATAEPTSLGQLGEYRLLEKLGEGGMGAVYRALHTKLGREVALKVLPKGRIDDQRAIIRFEREMMAVGAVDHPNIVRAMDAREIEGTRFLVMEFVDGLDLGKVVRRAGPLAVADACELVRQAALALQCACEHKLIHRDVKPSNLMLTRQGQVKLLDLGLARFQSDQPSGEEVTATGQPIGTVDYMAPEQVSETHRVDIRADIYGLGCTLYKLLTGRTPFSGPQFATPFHKMQAHLQKPVPSIRQFRRDVPKELITLLGRMLAKDPADRFTTPAEVADAIGPLATASDLPRLLTNAEGKSAAAAGLREAMTVTQEAPSSSALTHFLKQLDSDSHPPKVSQPDAADGHRTRLAIVVGCVAVGVLLVAILIAWRVKSGGVQPQPSRTEMVFDWPEELRKETALSIDRKPFDFPASAPLVIPCKPGEYHIRALREGFEPNERLITVGAGQRKSVAVFDDWIPEVKTPQSFVVVRWREADRNDAALEIDGTVCELSGPQVELTPNTVKLPLDVGPHKLWIVRRGFLPFEHEFTLAEGEECVVDVIWSKATPEMQKFPVPSQADQQAAGERIEAQLGPPAAETEQQKSELAGQRLRQGRQAADPAERFVLFQQAMAGAIEATDAALLLEAVEAMGTDFEVDLPVIKQEALAEFAGTATPLPDIQSLEEADQFAKHVAGSQKIAAFVGVVGQVALGDAYWHLSQMERAEARAALMLAAGHFYRQAQPEVLSGPLAEKFRFRLAQIAQVEADLEKVREATGKDQRYADALAAAEAMVAAWDFRAAAAELAQLQFEDQELAARLDGRRDDVRRLAELKSKMIATIDTAQPRLRKGALLLKGIDGELVKADEAAITARPDGRQDESHCWSELSRKSVQRLLALVVDRSSADDRLAAGLLALAIGDATAAEGHFREAQSLGARTDRYLDLLAAAALRDVTELLGSPSLDKSRLDKMQGQLNEMEKRHGASSWFASHRGALETAKEQVAERLRRIAQREAEELYARAAGLFNQGRYFELEPLLREFQQSFPGSAAATDPERQPSLAEMQAVVDNLGKSLKVRLDGRGDFRSIQEAILAAGPNSLIEIGDNGPYGEEIVVPAEKSGLTLRGKPGFLPIITTAGLKTNPVYVLTVRAQRTTIERLLLVNAKAPPSCTFIEPGSSLRARAVIMSARDVCLHGEGRHRCELDNCVTIGAITNLDRMVAKNCVSLKGGYFGNTLDLSNVVAASVLATGPSQLQSCTITGPVRFEANLSALLDSIVSQVEAVKPDVRIENCDVYSNSYLVLARPGKGCFSEDPKFSDPNSLDFRLAPTSPCRKRAADGGDLGCRYTPEMLEMLKAAFELRRRGIIKF